MSTAGLLRKGIEGKKLNVAHDDVLDVERESLLARVPLVVSRAKLDRCVRHKVLDDIPSLHGTELAVRIVLCHVIRLANHL